MIWHSAQHDTAQVGLGHFFSRERAEVLKKGGGFFQGAWHVWGAQGAGDLWAYRKAPFKGALCSL